jgi:hypothetical protein
MPKVNEDSQQLDREVDQLFGDSDWDDGPPDDCCSPTPSCGNWEHGHGAENSRQAASPRVGVTSSGVQAIPAIDAVRVHEETVQLAEAAETAAPSGACEDVTAARKGRLSMSGMSAGAAAPPTDWGRREPTIRLDWLP